MKKTNLYSFIVVAVIMLTCSAIPAWASDADVISAAQTNRSVWASRVTLENPSGASVPADSFILLPEHSGMNDTELVPVTLHRVDEATPCGASDIVASELGVATSIVQSGSGWQVTLPEGIPLGQTAQYDIIWGKIRYFGWQESASLPEGFPSGGNERASFLDGNLKTWRSANKEYDNGGGGISCEYDGWIYMDKCDHNGIIIPETIMRFVPGECWGGGTGTSTVFPWSRIFPTGSNICYIWTDSRYEWDGSTNYYYKRYGLQIFDSAGNTVNSVDGTYYNRASLSLPAGLIHGGIWITASQDVGSKYWDPEEAWFLVLDQNGNETIPKTVFDTIQNDNGSWMSLRNACELGSNAVFIWERYWETDAGDDRQEIAYEVRNTSGAISTITRFRRTE